MWKKHIGRGKARDRERTKVREKVFHNGKFAYTSCIFHIKFSLLYTFTIHSLAHSFLCAFRSRFFLTQKLRTKFFFNARRTSRSRRFNSCDFLSATAIRRRKGSEFVLKIYMCTTFCFALLALIINENRYHGKRERTSVCVYEKSCCSRRKRIKLLLLHEYHVHLAMVSLSLSIFLFSLSDIYRQVHAQCCTLLLFHLKTAKRSQSEGGEANC